MESAASAQAPDLTGKLNPGGLPAQLLAQWEDDDASSTETVAAR